MLNFYYYQEEGNLLPEMSGRSLVLLQRGFLPDWDTRYLSPLPLQHLACLWPWYGEDYGDALC